jgi:hypothetical protein
MLDAAGPLMVKVSATLPLYKVYVPASRCGRHTGMAVLPVYAGANPGKMTVKVVSACTYTTRLDGERLSCVTDSLDGDLARLPESPRREDGPARVRVAGLQRPATVAARQPGRWQRLGPA